jgi:hypothetical protein
MKNFRIANLKAKNWNQDFLNIKQGCYQYNHLEVGKNKVKLSLGLTKHNTVKTYLGVEV